MNRDHSAVFEAASKYCILDSSVDHDGYSISSERFLPTVVDMIVKLNSPISVHLSLLIPRMSTFTLAISCLTTSNLPWFMDLSFQVPMQYCFMASDLASITCHMHSWVLFLLWLHPFILSGVTSALISSSVLGTYGPGEFPFQYPIILPFHTVHGVLKARILKCFAILFSSGPCFVRTLHHDPSILDGPTRPGLEFHWVRQGCGPCDQFD